MGHLDRWWSELLLRMMPAEARKHLKDLAESTDGESRLLARGWDQYAREWSAAAFRVRPGYQVRHLGDEWTAEPEEPGRPPGNGVAGELMDHIAERLLDPYLPSYAQEGMEIGPGGGRVTALLLHRTRVLHAVDPSAAMLQHLRRRFSDVTTLRYHHTDGMTLPGLSPGSLDYVLAFDVFVHFEPRLVYWYLRQIARLLRPSGVGIIHYANIITPLGWKEFERTLSHNVQRRMQFGAFGVMCPELMGQFLRMLDLEVVAVDTALIPRDGVAVFVKPGRMENI